MQGGTQQASAPPHPSCLTPAAWSCPLQYPESTSALVQKIAQLQRAAGLEGVLVDPYSRTSGCCSLSGLHGNPAHAALVCRSAWEPRPVLNSTGAPPWALLHCKPAQLSIVVPAGTGVTVTGWAALACIISLVVVTALAGVLMVRRLTGQDKPHTQYVKSGDA